MSTDEQDLLLGRLTREDRECRQGIAALEAKLRGFSTALSDVALKLSGTWNPKPNPVLSIDDGIKALADIPDTQSVIATLNELRSLRERARVVATQLAAMNG